MRNLDECQAEVFRRSEKRIKARKQNRKRIMIACVPLVLCIVVCGTLLVSDVGNPTDEQTRELFQVQYSGAMGTDAVGGLFAGSVAVSGNGKSCLYTSAEDVQNIVKLLNSIMAVPEMNGGDDGAGFATNEDTAEAVSESCTETGFTIVVKGGDGSCAEYLLTGSLLIDKTTQERFPMDEDSCFALKEALGIPCQ